MFQMRPSSRAPTLGYTSGWWVDQGNVPEAKLEIGPMCGVWHHLAETIEQLSQHLYVGQELPKSFLGPGGSEEGRIWNMFSNDNKTKCF